MNRTQQEITEGPKVQISFTSILLGLIVLVALIAIIATHLNEVHNFATLLKKASPGWLLVALLLQIGTYVCEAATWREVMKTAGYTLRIRNLAQLAIEKLSVNQLLPSGGVSGNVVVGRALQRLGIPSGVSLEALIVEVFSYDAAFVVAAIITLLALWAFHDITPLILELGGLFAIVLSLIPIGILWVLHHRNWQPPQWMRKWKALMSIKKASQQVSVDRIFAPRALFVTSLFQIMIFFLDGVTLWVMMRVTESPVSLLAACIALVIGTMAGIVSFLPGGIGSFEIGCTTTLVLLGAPLEAALTGAIFLRALTLWLPLIPGLYLARKEIMFGR